MEGGGEERNYLDNRALGVYHSELREYFFPPKPQIYEARGPFLVFGTCYFIIKTSYFG